MRRRPFQSFLNARDGVAMIELAFVMPFLLLILFGGIEVARYMLIVQKVDKTAYAMSDLISRYPPATAAGVDGELDVDEVNNVVLRQFENLVKPYDEQDGSIILSSIRKENGTILIKWEVATPSGYEDGETISIVSGLTPSTVNASGASLRDRPAVFDASMTSDLSSMQEFENMVVSEVFFRYRPILSNVLQNLELPFTLGDTTLVRRVYARPRAGDLICLPPTFVHDDCQNNLPVFGSCDTVTGSGSCLDECSRCRPNGRVWCSVSTRSVTRCNGGGNTIIGGACLAPPVCP